MDAQDGQDTEGVTWSAPGDLMVLFRKVVDFKEFALNSLP